MLADTPHVNKLLEVLTNESGIFLILEWCPLGNLQNLDVIMEGQMQSLCIQLASALLSLKRFDIVYMDVNLENIFVTTLAEDSIQVELGDFSFHSFAKKVMSHTTSVVSSFPVSVDPCDIIDF